MKTTEAKKIYKKCAKSRWWFRNSTNQWVYEVRVEVDQSLSGTYRYPTSNKLFAYFLFLRSYKEDILEDIKAYCKS